MTYATPYRIRMAKSARYWRNPDQRLRAVNRERAKRGQPPLSSVDEIMSLAADRARIGAQGRQRGPDGRWL